jgi:hypothetical protein
MSERSEIMAERLISQADIRVSLVAENGLGYGQGAISYVDGITSRGISEELLTDIRELVATPQILVDIDVDEDNQPVMDQGCPDGREAIVVTRGHETLNRSLNRAKVFGGGVVMGVASTIAIEGANAGQSLSQVYDSTISRLLTSGIDFGAHTDHHINETISGCGAIDKSPEIIRNIALYRDQIAASIDALGVSTEGLTDVLDNFASYAETMVDDDYFGRAIVDGISSKGKIVKQLGGSHNELFILLNTVTGKTINQASVRRISDDKAQVFGVDVWAMTHLATVQFPDDPEKQAKAFLGELVYSLGVAATLTKGDLPVYLVQEA